MKNLKPLFLFGLLVLGLSFGCKKHHHGPHDFTAVFFTDGVSFAPDAVCPDPFNILNIQEGEGTATRIKEFTTRITFCVDPETFRYVNGEGSFVAKNGDEIFFTVEGQIFPTDNPDYDLEFKDPFVITGGTGHFKNASGSGMTDSFFKQATNRTDHVWKGTISFDH